jgi:hypothetical protein
MDVHFKNAHSAVLFHFSEERVRNVHAIQQKNCIDSEKRARNPWRKVARNKLIKIFKKCILNLIS